MYMSLRVLPSQVEVFRHGRGLCIVAHIVISQLLPPPCTARQWAGNGNTECPRGRALSRLGWRRLSNHAKVAIACEGRKRRTWREARTPNTTPLSPQLAPPIFSPLSSWGRGVSARARSADWFGWPSTRRHTAASDSSRPESDESSDRPVPGRPSSLSPPLRAAVAPSTSSLIDTVGGAGDTRERRCSGEARPSGAAPAVREEA